MPIRIRAGGALKNIATLSVAVDGVLRPAKRVRVLRGNTLREVFSTAAPLSVALLPEQVFGYSYAPGPAPVTSEVMTATVSGGRAPFTYAWGQSGGFFITAPTNASTQFSKLIFGSSETGIVTCRVTDANGQQATATGFVELTNYNSGIPI